MTHTMTLGISRNKISQIIGTSFSLMTKNKLIFFSVIATKHVDIVIEQKIDSIN